MNQKLEESFRKLFRQLAFFRKISCPLDKSDITRRSYVCRSHKAKQPPGVIRSPVSLDILYTHSWGYLFNMERSSGKNSDRAVDFVVSTFVLLAASWIVYLSRIYTRLWLVRGVFLEDVFITIGMVSNFKHNSESCSI